MLFFYLNNAVMRKCGNAEMKNLQPATFSRVPPASSHLSLRLRRRTAEIHRDLNIF